jgi:hypothetical protein
MCVIVSFSPSALSVSASPSAAKIIVERQGSKSAVISIKENILNIFFFISTLPKVIAPRGV